MLSSPQDEARRGAAVTPQGANAPPSAQIAGQPTPPFAPDLHDVRHLWLKGVLLLLWALVSFGASYFARDLQFLVGPWPLGYWMVSQGALLFFIVLVVVYCLVMRWFERHDQRSQATPDPNPTA